MNVKFNLFMMIALFMSFNLFSQGNIVDISQDIDPEALSAAIAAQTEAATIIINSEVEYFLDSPKLNYALTIESQGEKGVIKIKSGFDFGESAPTVENLTFKNIELLGDNPAEDYVSNWSQEGTLQEYVFEDCLIHSFRGAVRIKDSEKVVIEKVVFDNSIAKEIGGYGFFNQDNGNAETFVDEVVIENSTIADVERILVSKNTFGSVKISDCTFYKTPRYGRSFIDLDDSSAEIAGGVVIENVILAEPLNGDPKFGVKGVANVTVTNSYVTNEFDWNSISWGTAAESPFIAYEGSSVEMFRDVNNFDFLIVDEAFAGKDNSGDPRYYFDGTVGIEKNNIDILYYIDGNSLVLDKTYSLVEVYALQGQKIISENNVDKIEIDNPGLYIVRVIDYNQKKSIIKVVK